jgi:putative endopeptidase
MREFAACLVVATVTCCGAQTLIRLPSVDVTAVDSSVSPCDNFYQYACGKLDAANPIPPDQAAWGSFNKLAEWNRTVLRQLLEASEAPGTARTPNEQKVGDLYGSCMEQASSKADDLKAIEPLQGKIEAIRSRQLLFHAAPEIGNAWRDTYFAYSSALFGQLQQPPDWRRCATTVDTYLGEALGQVYVAKVFPPESKVRVQAIIKGIEAAMDRDIDAVTWMQPATKREAHLKLAAVLNKVGYPDKWIDYTGLQITRASYPLNVERATAFESKRQLAFIGKPLDRTQWFMTPPTVNAYEDPQTNTINFPAGILQPVFFDPKADDVINYGTLGAVVGHELTHDFDDQGRKFDVKGNLRDWWSAEDAKEYDARGSCIASEYTGPVPGIPGVQQNGRLTQGEDTGDNGGIHLTLSALSEDLKSQGKSLDDKDKDGLTNLQRFFLAYGNLWCSQTRLEAARTRVLTNPHSMPVLRVNNVISNMPEFQQAFACKTGQPMVHAPQCRVW